MRKVFWCVEIERPDLTVSTRSEPYHSSAAKMSQGQEKKSYSLQPTMSPSKHSRTQQQFQIAVLSKKDQLSPL